MMKLWNFFLFVGILICSGHSHASKQQDISEIRTAASERVKDYLVAIYGSEKTEKDIEFRVSNMDSRLRLPQCDTALQAEPKESGFGAKQLSVKVYCATGSRWTIYVPVSISIYDKVAVSTRNLQRGEKLNESDFVMRRTNTSSIGQSYLDSETTLLGMEVNRPIRSGSIIKVHDIREPIVIAKGDSVTLEANQGALQVSSVGIALANGRMGEQIRVQNSRSKRIVDARVTGPGQAEVR